MSARSFDPDLTRPSENGVYFVGHADLERLARQARRHELVVRRIDLAGCRSKQALLQQLAEALPLPASFGDNWDALADCLRDPRWEAGWGHVLLLDHVDDLHHAAAADFDLLLGILDDAATFGSEQEQPWFAFLALTDDAAGRPHAAA